MVFKHDFKKCVDFTRIASSNTAIDDVANWSHIEYLIQIYHIFVLIL